jgi:hypothetical protein
MKSNPNAVNYTEFISLINSLLLLSEDFSARIKALTEKDSKNLVDLRANLSGSIRTLIDNFSGYRAQKSRRSYEEIIRRLTSQFLQNTDIGEMIFSQFVKKGLDISPAEAFATVGALIQDSMVLYFEKHGLIEYQKDLGDNFESELKRLEKELINFSRSYDVKRLL